MLPAAGVPMGAAVPPRLPGRVEERWVVGLPRAGQEERHQGGPVPNEWWILQTAGEETSGRSRP